LGLFLCLLVPDVFIPMNKDNGNVLIHMNKDINSAIIHMNKDNSMMCFHIKKMKFADDSAETGEII
jgi:hypothetical protein